MTVEEYYRKRNIRDVEQGHSSSYYSGCSTTNTTTHHRLTHYDTTDAATTMTPSRKQRPYDYYYDNESMKTNMATTNSSTTTASSSGSYSLSLLSMLGGESKTSSSQEEIHGLQYNGYNNPQAQHEEMTYSWNNHRNNNHCFSNRPHPNTTTVISFRRIQPKDRTQIQALHEEWFPVEYQDEFYDDLCWHQKMCHSGHDLYTMVATIPKKMNNNLHGDNKNDDDDHDDDHDNDNNDPSDEQIIACLVGCVLSAHKLNASSRELLVPSYPHRHSKLFYIMTLGTVTEYRHLGLASQLVQQVADRVIGRDVELGTLYLHVITLNEAAIRFYENKLGFWRVQEIQDYYTIDGEHYNCYLYAKYFHGQSCVNK